MASYLEGQAALERKLRAIRDELPDALRPVLVKAGNEIAADARTLAETSRQTGALIASIHVTGPGEATPPHSTGGGQRTAGEFEVLVTAGNTNARHAHLVEGGTQERTHKDGTSTGTMRAQPYFNVAFRLNRTRLQRRINTALRRAFRKAVQG